jgi:hypothetical protein
MCDVISSRLQGLVLGLSLILSRSASIRTKPNGASRSYHQKDKLIHRLLLYRIKSPVTMIIGAMLP